MEWWVPARMVAGKCGVESEERPSIIVGMSGYVRL